MPSQNNDRAQPLISLQQAKAQVLDGVSPISDIETQKLTEALDRVLAVPVTAKVDVPGHDNSAMDGFALRASDASSETTQLRLIGDSFAGRPYNGTVGVGECVRIMTGGVVPEGANAIVMQERTQVTGDIVNIKNPVYELNNVRRAGQDFTRGKQVLNAGHVLAPADLGVLASVGIAETQVWRRPRIAFFSTGDELRNIGETLAPGQIYDSNRYSLHGLISHMHCDFTDLGVIADDPHALEQALQKASAYFDAIITTGGVSVGAADHVVDVLKRCGEIGFWRVAVKPGKPFAFGKINQTLFFGLPGNPVSAVVGFMQFVRPALVKLAGAIPVPPLQFAVSCNQDIKKSPGRLELQRGKLIQQDNGLSVTPFGNQGSGVLRSMSQADCFIVLEADCNGVNSGQSVTVEPFVQRLWA